MEQTNICIRWANAVGNEPCAICGRYTEQYGDLALFIEGTGKLVCLDCGHERAPRLAQLCAQVGQVEADVLAAKGAAERDNAKRTGFGMHTTREDFLLRLTRRSLAAALDVFLKAAEIFNEPSALKCALQHQAEALRQNLALWERFCPIGNDPHQDIPF